VRKGPIVTLSVLLAACTPGVAATTTSRPPASTSSPATPTPTTMTSSPTTATPTSTTPPVTTTAPTTTSSAPPEVLSPFARPAWLGTRILPLGPDGENGIPQPTPPELLDRRLETPDVLEPPTGEDFASSIGPVPDDVLVRSTWTEDCPLALDELAYVTVTHFGFDGDHHTGELIVNAGFAERIVGVFEQLHAARFPIEEMRVITQADLDAAPTGDGNETTGFSCRPAVGSGSWSMHAYGLAIDINPFHNPYLKGELVLPELATAYVDRERVLPGMMIDGDVAVEAFAAIGWEWGGHWNTLKDWMHFSENGR
jgi:hypothetical protein